MRLTRMIGIFSILLSLFGIPLAISTQAQSDSQTLVWKKESGPTRRKQSRSHHRAEPKPLLALEWRLVKRGPHGEVLEGINPLATFYSGDQFRFMVRPNQDGYLYVFNLSESPNGQPLEPLRLIFPDSRNDNGRNFIRKDREYVFPSDCPEFNDSKDCWFKFDSHSGNEVFTVVFSRDLISDLLVMGEGVDQQRVIENLKRSSSQILNRNSRPHLKNGSTDHLDPFAIWVTNTNVKNNQELIDGFSLKHEAEP